MRYLLLNLGFMLGVIIAAKLYSRKTATRPMFYALLGVVALTAFFDSLLIIMGVFEYNPANILGIHIWRAPVEDFAYAIVSVFLVALLWEYYESKK